MGGREGGRGRRGREGGWGGRREEGGRGREGGREGGWDGWREGVREGGEGGMTVIHIDGLGHKPSNSEFSTTTKFHKMTRDQVIHHV